MNIKGLNKAEVLMALYNRATVQGMGVLQEKKGNMAHEEAIKILDGSDNKYFDYLKGRVMKISLKGDELDTRLYNRDNGEGAAEQAINKLLTLKADKEKDNG